MQLLFLRNLQSSGGNRPPTVHFNEADVMVEEYTANCDWTGTKEGLKHHTNMLKFYPTGNSESLKNSKWVPITTVAVWMTGRYKDKSRAIQYNTLADQYKGVCKSPGKQCDGPELSRPTVATMLF